MYYVDIFQGCLVEEKDPYSPPERYYEYRCGQPGVITESYIVDDDSPRSLEFDHLAEENWTVAGKKRKKFFEENKIQEDDLILYAYTVPPEIYEKMVNKYIKHEEK